MRGSRKKFPGSGPMESCVCQGWSEAYLLNWVFFLGGGQFYNAKGNLKFPGLRRWGGHQTPPPQPIL